MAEMMTPPNQQPQEEEDGKYRLGPESFDAPIPGESLTVEPGKYPYERPPEFTDVDDALDWLLERLVQPKVATETLALMESGVAVSVLVEMLLQSGFGEGKWSAPMMYLMAPPLTIILTHMADAAGVGYMVTPEDGKPEPISSVLMRKKSASVGASQVAKGRASVKDAIKNGPPAAPQNPQKKSIEKPSTPMGGMMSPFRG